MASTASSFRKSFKYDVYLSFRGEDTRSAFVDHLYFALTRQGIHTFRDDMKIMRGGNILDELNRAIQDSRFLIIVFSKNYASSSWCLNELVQIMECYKTTKQRVYPVFYDVDPSDVRRQRGAVGRAFDRLDREESAGKWRQAMTEAGNLTGFVGGRMDEVELVKNIVKEIKRLVEEISLELRSTNVYNNNTIVGMEPQIEEVLSSLKIGSGDVRIIGITGMGGIGKTTFSRAIFDILSSHHFVGKSFVEKVREVSKATLSGLKSLQKKMLSDVLNDERITISSVDKGKSMIKKELSGRKVLIVLDDVDHEEQLKALAGAPDWFKKGSVIIITTRDEQLLRGHGVTQIHPVRLLSKKEALGLFSWYAFGRDYPSQWFEHLSLEVVRLSACLPLAIKILGSFLCGKDMDEWENVLQSLENISLEEGLKIISLKKTLEILELSYISLGNTEKEIFLDVACFMNGLRKNDAIRILESCGFPIKGLRTLELKSLLTISNERLELHDYIEEMGRNIVRRSHPHQPELHSRLWMREEIEPILANHRGTEATRRVQLSELQLSPKTVMEGFGSMEELRCLIVESENDNDDPSGDWEFDEVRQYLPNALQFLRWVDYPARSLPETFQPHNLVALEMPYSRITQLWEGGERKVLNHLRFLDLSNSMLETLDLGLTPKLQWLELRECHDLVELGTPDGCLERIVHVDITGCLRFNSFSFMKRLETMEVISLSELCLIAKPLKELPRYASDNLPNLQFTCNYRGEQQLSEIENGHKSVSLHLQPCTKLKSVSGSICGLQHLRHLTLEGCIPEVPNDLDQLAYLEKLNLVSTHITCLPYSICMLKHLKALKLKSCELLEKLPERLDRLESLEKLSLLSSRITCLPDSICMLKNLKSLKLKSCLLLEKVPENLGKLESLEKLNLLSSRIRHLPDSICKLKHLKSLVLKSCGLLEKLPDYLGQLEGLEKLMLSECMSLEDIPHSICEMKCLRELNVKSSGISQLPQSMSMLKDVRIIGSKAVLQSSGLALEVQISEGETFCYIKP